MVSALISHPNSHNNERSDPKFNFANLALMANLAKLATLPSDWSLGLALAILIGDCSL